MQPWKNLMSLSSDLCYTASHKIVAKEGGGINAVVSESERKRTFMADPHESGPNRMGPQANRRKRMPGANSPRQIMEECRIRYDRELNPVQLEAVRHTQGPLLVIAGAGSGKTRTLTYRVAYLVEKGVNPSAILLLTFTRKASQEMLRRAAQLLDHRCRNVSGGTFHSFANRVLRRYGSALGIDPAFSIMDRTDTESLIGLLRKELDAVAKHRSFPRKNTLATIFSRAVNKVLPIEEVVLADYAHFANHLEAVLELYRAYIRRKSEHHFLDYDDLLIFLLKLLREHPDLRDRISGAYRHIMVDEYQDTNKIQAEILYLLTSTHENIMVVGDDSQSIYGFRGANFRNIIDFPKRYSGTRIIGLEENYRSVQPVLDLTNLIIDRAREKFAKNLFTRRSGGIVPSLVETRDESGQSRFIVRRISELRQSGLCLRDIAVLFRASFHSFDLEIELARENIPFIKVGGFKFTESAHIKDVLAHFRIIVNPLDRINWYRVLLLVDKIGPRSAQKIYEAILKQKAGYAGLLSPELNAGSGGRLERLKKLYAAVDERTMSLTEKGEAVLDYYLPILKAKYDDHPRRAKDLEHLVEMMDRYEGLESFLTDMALEPPNTSRDNTMALETASEDRLVLSTIHSAKGLEWEAVFIIWALDGRFPSVHSLHKPEEIEEELRLMYVAATRAKENLTFTYPSQVYDRSSGLVLNRPSRFIEDVPDAVLEKVWHSEWEEDAW
jgi:DNA helicase-2/ATP-dependent DNA helicase PcrA